MGKFFEEFSEGDQFKTPARTITLADITNFAGITGDFNPVHTDLEFAKTLPFGERIAHGPMLVGMTFGLLSRIDLIDGTVIALRSIAWNFEQPVKPDDTVHVLCTVTKTHRSTSTPERGFVEFDLQIVNQRNERVQRGSAGVILMCR